MGFFLVPRISFAAEDKNQFIKAISLYKLLNYVGFEDGGVEPKFCFTSTDLFAAALKKINAQNREMTRFKGREISKYPECNIIYFDDGVNINLKKYILENERELLVSDRKGFVELYDGIIELSEKKGKIGFIINLKKAKRVGIKISSKLIESAQEIY